jgi:large subunit ribosomal protein L10
MNLEQKKAAVTELADILQSAKAMVLLSQNGIDMEMNTSMRRALRKDGGQFRVIKNTMFARAVEGTPWAYYADMMKGPLAVAYTQKDPAAFAKALTTLLKGVAKAKVVGGSLGTSPMSEAQLKALAALPSADVLKGMLLGALVGVPKKFLGVLQAPARDFMGVLKAREKQLADQAA